MPLKLKYWRKRRALSIDELAEKAKVSPQTIVRIELHGVEPRPKTVRKLAGALEVELDELLIDAPETLETEQVSESVD